MNKPSTKGQVVGYVRVSTTEQNPARQYEALGECDRVFTDKVSGKSRTERAALNEMIAYVRDGDVVRVASLDRLARSLRDLLALVEELTGKGVTVEFDHERLTFAPGSSDPRSGLMLGILGAFAEFERAIIRERQAEGIALAKAAGKYRGRAKRLTPEQIEAARQRVAEGVPVARVARDLGVARTTLYDALSGRGAYAQSADAAA